MSESKSNLPIPPGEYLREVMTERGCRVTLLSHRMHCSVDNIYAIRAGDQPITPGVAAQFEEWLGVPAHIWLGLEKEYRDTLERLKGEQ